MVRLSVRWAIATLLLLALCSAFTGADASAHNPPGVSGSQKDARDKFLAKAAAQTNAISAKISPPDSLSKDARAKFLAKASAQANSISAKIAGAHAAKVAHASAPAPAPAPAATTTASAPAPAPAPAATTTGAGSKRQGSVPAAATNVKIATAQVQPKPPRPHAQAGTSHGAQTPMEPIGHHKRLWPLNNTDFVGIALAVIGLILAAGGGIGGGGVLVPVYIEVLRFGAKFAIPLSNITIFGGSIVNTWQNWTKRHPDADRPLVDWDLILVMEPMTIAGAVIGSFLNKLLPESVITVMLVIVLGFTGARTLMKGVEAFQKESKAVSPDAIRSSPARAGYGTISSDDEPPSPMLDEILRAESQTPLDKVKKLFLIFGGVLALEVLRGLGRAGMFPDALALSCGAAGWWTLVVATLAWILVWTAFIRRDLVRMFHTKQEHSYKYVSGDIRWDELNTIKYPLVCSMAGLVAGMFGIGGGIVKGPLMLEMGVHPQVAAATSACMIFYTTFTASVQFVIFGLMQMDYAMMLFVVGVAATYAGQLATNYVLQRYKRNSAIIFLIGIVVVLSAIFMGAEGFYSVSVLSLDQRRHGGSVCKNGA